MSQISLRKLISRPEVAAMVGELVSAVGSVISIHDAKGTLLVGESNHISIYASRVSDRKSDLSLQECGGYPCHKYILEFEGEVLGWLVGNEKALSIVSFLTYLVQRERERKDLASEVLEKYREINLLYNISEKMATCLRIVDIAELIIDEARKLINATTAVVMLRHEETQKLEIIASRGSGSTLETAIKLGEGIVSHVIRTGKAEIVNDIGSDPRFACEKNKNCALICAPLMIQGRTTGVICISNAKAISYTAQDLKLLNALTSHASAAIENAFLHENKLKEERIKNNLERYLSPQVVEAIIGSKEAVSLDTTRQKVTMLFSDIRGFTTKCEELAPEEIVMYLNEYFTHMVSVIFGHQGTVNKFVGDMIVAMFGAPSQLIDGERRAIEAAIAMQVTLQTMPVQWIRDNFATGIGISSGEVVVGNIGSPSHMDYTAIGDEVNIASRLQSIAQGGQILVSRGVYDITKHFFTFKEFGIVPVKGKKKAVEIFEVIY